jgi:ionotropic glutamate receptor
LIVWVFFFLILSSGYTANLATMLTVQQLKPTINSIDELRKSGENIGYHDGSFVKNLLEDLNFNTSKIKAYDTPDDFYNALSKGSNNGGIAAFVHEVPYIKLFLAKHCKEYTMVGPFYKTAGFGYVSNFIYVPVCNITLQSISYSRMLKYKCETIDVGMLPFMPECKLRVRI